MDRRSGFRHSCGALVGPIGEEPGEISTPQGSTASPRGPTRGDAVIRVKDLLAQLPPNTEERVEEARVRLQRLLREAVLAETRFTSSSSVDDSESAGGTLRVMVRTDAVGVPMALLGMQIPDEAELAARLLIWRPDLAALYRSTSRLSDMPHRLGHLLGSVPGFAELEPSINMARELARVLLARIKEYNLLERIFAVDEDVLGVAKVKASSSTIDLYWGSIGLAAYGLGLSVEAMTAAVLAHEYAHVFLLSGFDIDGRQWDRRSAAEAGRDVHEPLAQYYAARALWALRRRLPDAFRAHAVLLPLQPVIYRLHCPLFLEEFSPEAVRPAVISIRRHPVASFDGLMERVHRHAVALGGDRGRGRSPGALGRDWSPDAPIDAVVTLNKVLDAYLEHRALRLRPTTLRRYRENVELFRRFLGGWFRGRASTPEVLSRPLLESYYAWLLKAENGLHGRARTADTARKIAEVAQLAWKWADESERWPDIIPRPRTIEMVRALPRPVSAPSWGEMDACVAACEGWIRCLAVMLRSTGLRVGETMQLRWSDANLDSGRLTIRPEVDKSGRGRVIPLAPFLLGEMQGWGRREGYIVPENTLLHHEVPVDADGLGHREQRELAVAVAPAGLHEARASIQDEEGDRLAEEIGRRDEVGVEDGHVLAPRGLQPLRQRAGLEARAVRAVQVPHVVPLRAELCDEARDQRRGLVRRVVEDLDLVPVRGVVEGANGAQQPLHDESFVPYRELRRDDGQILFGDLARETLEQRALLLCTRAAGGARRGSASRSSSPRTGPAPARRRSRRPAAPQPIRDLTAGSRPGLRRSTLRAHSRPPQSPGTAASGRERHVIGRSSVLLQYTVSVRAGAYAPQPETSHRVIPRTDQ